MPIASRSVVPLVPMLGYRASPRSFLVVGIALAYAGRSFAQSPAITDGTNAASARDRAADSSMGRDPAAAEALFRSGRQLLQEGRLEEAFAKFQESYRLDPTAGAVYNQGECRLRQGKTASAWALYKQAAALAYVQGKSDQYDLAVSRVDQLQTDLSYVTFHVAEPVPGLEVTRDGVLVGRAQYDVALPIDPGRYTIGLKAPGYESVEVAVVVGEKHDRQTINLPKLKERALGVSAAPLQTFRTTTRVVEVKASPWPWVIGAAGATSLLIGSVSGILAIRENHQMEQACPQHVNCSNDVIVAQGRRDLESNIAWVGIPVGLAAIGTTVAWTYVSQKIDNENKRHMGITVETAGRSLGLHIMGDL